MCMVLSGISPLSIFLENALVINLPPKLLDDFFGATGSID